MSREGRPSWNPCFLIPATPRPHCLRVASSLLVWGLGKYNLQCIGHVSCFKRDALVNYSCLDLVQPLIPADGNEELYMGKESSICP